jgi:hypothetical protein
MPRSPDPSPRPTIPPGPAVARVICALALGACKVAPPPPLVPFHTTTAADPVGESSVLVIVGGAIEGLGGAGIGAALRMQHQYTDRTALGLELAAGYGDADKTRFAMFALRGYGRTTPRDNDWTCVTYGAGLSALTTGMVAVGAHGAIAVSYPNDSFVPYTQIGLALVVPIAQGASFGDMADTIDWPTYEVDAPPQERRGVRTNLYLTIDPGFVVPIPDSGHALSLDVGVAYGLRRGTGFISASLADQVHR